MISRFFIDRPIFANVIAIVTVLLGVVALYKPAGRTLPADHPADGRCQHQLPGANARVVADTVAAPIEQQINGVENMMYMSSTSSSDGSYSLTVTFEIGTNLNDAQVLVQNRLSVAEPQLARGGSAAGGAVKKQSPNIVLAISLTAPPPKDQFDLTLDPAGLGRHRNQRDEVLAAVRATGLDCRPAPDRGTPGFYRVTASNGFAPDGPAGADKLRRSG
jgi:hydrophobic/amphiphilic exporter-1 (mainly G- bacteria), HAE1 family